MLAEDAVVVPSNYSFSPLNRNAGVPLAYKEEITDVFDQGHFFR